MHLQDAKFLTLRNLGYTGTLDDMLLAFYKFTLGSLPGYGATPDAEQKALITLVVTPTASQIDDLWFQYLRGLGYTGSLRDMEYQYWTSTLDTGAFDDGFDDGFL